MDTFRITASLRTPVALGNTFLTLDAVLFGILKDLAELGLSEADPLTSIPLKQENGLYYATMAFFESPVALSETKIGAIRPVKDMADASGFIRPPGKRLAKVVTTRGQTKGHLSRYKSIAADTIYWLAIGDPEKAKTLLERAGAVGALRKDGHGEISTVDIEVLPGNESVLIDQNGMVTRPIPADLARELGINTNSPTSMDTWKPPYWDQKKTDCLTPERLL